MLSSRSLGLSTGTLNEAATRAAVSKSTTSLTVAMTPVRMSDLMVSTLLRRKIPDSSPTVIVAGSSTGPIGSSGRSTTRVLDSACARLRPPPLFGEFECRLAIYLLSTGRESRAGSSGG